MKRTKVAKITARKIMAGGSKSRFQFEYEGQTYEFLSFGNPSLEGGYEVEVKMETGRAKLHGYDFIFRLSDTRDIFGARLVTRPDDGIIKS
jgi:hypothetical protein